MFGVSVGIMDGAGGAAGGSYESIATVTPTSGAADFTFTSIPSTYKHLQIRSIYKDTSTSSGQLAPIYVQFNGDTGNNYADHYLRGNGSSVVASNGVSSPWMRVDGVGVVSTSGAYGASIIDVVDYASTSKNKTMRAFAGGDGNIAQTNYMVSLTSGLWMNTTAITSIKIIAGNSGFASGCVFSLYGIKGD